MRTLRFLLALAFLAPIALLPTPASADGIIIPDPPICFDRPCPEPFPIAQLAIEYHRVQVSVENQVAITRVDQVFRNDNDWTLEGTYIFPIPPGATVTSFTLWVDGEPVKAEILEKDEARRIYEDIVRNLRDPALLEYLDRGAVRASIFPIQPGERRQVELEYTQVLQPENGLFHYRYPLNTEKFSTEPIEQVSVSVDVDSAQPVKAIYSPSHEIAIDRDGDHRFTAGYEENDVLPDRDFELFYSVAEEDIGLTLLTYRDPDEDEAGFFLLLVAPEVERQSDTAVPKDVILVLDKSGSMEGEKFEQAQAALCYVIEHLNAKDRFSIIAFSTGTDAYASGLRLADEANEARAWVDQLSAQGSTDINLALLEALDQADHERPTILIFLTDGLPTEGVTDTPKILMNVEEAARSNIRLFAFGVGYDVDTYLLDSLAQAHHGATTYVTPGQAIDEAVSGFYAKVSTPVLTDIELDFGGITIFDQYPEELPDLFAGTQLVLVGRYRKPGDAAIRLSGYVEGERVSTDYPGQTFRASGGPDFLPRLWATRKIGALLNKVRLEGPDEELIDQIVYLSIRYGIVTPYTSYLVTEPMALGAEAQDRIAEEAYDKMLSTPAPVFGQAAVERAAGESAIGGANVPMAPPAEAAEIVKVAGTKAFRLIDGVWTDTAFDPEAMTTKAVPFLSEDYFLLANARPELAMAMALGGRVIVVSEGIAYEVIGADEKGDAIDIPEPEPTDRPAVESGETGEPEPGEIDHQPGLPVPCPGIAGLLGLAVLPTGLLRTRRPRA